jgi:DNA-binding XRE family transcriptional regulator
MEFSEQIKHVRSVLDISQEDLARALNVSFATVNRWENGKTRPIKVARIVFKNFCESNGIDFGGTIVAKNPQEK